MATVGRALAAEGIDVKPNRLRLPALAGRVAERADGLIQRTGRYVQAVHVLGEMDKTIACDISVAREELGYEPADRARGGHAAQRALVPGSGALAVRSLVTGGNGYFGRLLAEHLRARGDAVRVLDIDVDGAGGPGVEVVQGDIRDEGRVREAVDGVDVVYHNVAQVPLAKDPHLLRSVNVDGTALLLAASAEAGVSKVVHTSSSAVFGVPESNPVLPTTVPKPQEAYGEAKLAAEWACLRAAADGLDVSIVRPRTILGHGRLGIFGILFDWIADGADPIVLGDGTNRYQFVHADDLADVCLLAGRPLGSVDLQRRHRPVRHDGARPSSTCAEHAGTGAQVRRLPAGPAAAAMQASAALRLTPFAPYHWLMYARSMWFDIEHVREQLGWTPRWSTDEMFAQSYDWFLAHRAEASAGRRRHLAPPAHRPLRRARRARSTSPGSCRRSADDAQSNPGRAGAARPGWPSRCWRALAYVPALASSPGKMPADTKLYLYLEPGPADQRRAVDVRRPPVRRLGAPPGHRLPVAAGPVVLAGRHRPACPTGSSTGCGSARSCSCRRRRRAVAVPAPLRPGLARRARRGARLPAVAVPPARTCPGRRRCCCRGPASAGSSA